MEAMHWPLVGREADLRTITSALTERPGRSLVITGPPGVGRTRLAREAMALAERRGRPTRWATATGAAALVPLGALAHLLPAVDVGSSGLALLQQATSAIAGDGAGPAPVLCVDDVHLLDQMSVTLLHQLAAGGAVSLVLTVRSGAAGPDPAAPLWKDGLADRIQLEPLRRAEIVRLVGQVLGGDVETRTAERLWRLTGGNPLYLRELVEDGLRTGRLARSDGLWRWGGGMRPSQRLCEIVLAQLGDLDTAGWRVLEIFATAEPLPARVVETLGDPETVAQLERRGIVIDDAEAQLGLLRAAHPLFTEVVRTRAPEAALRSIRHQVGAASPNVESEGLALARCTALLDSDPPAPDARGLTEAAWRAAGAFDHRLAARLARAAVDAGGGVPAYLALIEAAGWLSRPAEVDRLAGQAMQAAVTDEDRAEVTVSRVLSLACALGQVTQARAVLEEQAARVSSARGGALLAATGAVLAVLEGDPRRAVAQARGLLATTARGETAWRLALVAGALGLAVTGSSRSALAMVEEGWATVVPSESGTAVGFVRLALAHAEMTALALSGQVQDLERRAAELLQGSLLLPEWSGDAVASLHCGWAALTAGRVRVAVRWLAEAHAGLRRADPVGLLNLCRALLATARALLGDGAGAHELMADPDDPAHPGVPAHAPFVLLARALVAGTDGDAVEACRLGREAADRAAHQGQIAVEAVILHATFRFGRRPEDVNRLRALTERLDSPLVADLADYVHAVLADDGEDLDRLSRRFEDAGLLLTAADAAAEAAAAHERKGFRRTAASAMTRAVTLARECGLSGSPSVERLAPPSLTAREEEVARLASWGMSNVGIAERLVVSVRTVEAHLSHIYGKLGITSRGELAGALVAPESKGPGSASANVGLVPPARRAPLPVRR
jgi:DNA-binding CsgD family transcriptional regulator